MAEFPSLPLWTDAYLADTRHLSTQEHGAYLLLLMEAWRRPTCSLPNDDKMLARLSGLSEQEWFKIKDIILDFWSYDAKRKEWVQSRLLKERDYVSKLSSKRRVAAVSRWNKTKKDDANAMQDSMQNGCKTDAPTPTPTPTNNNSNELLENEKKSKKKNGGLEEFKSILSQHMSEGLLNDFITHRRSKKASNTETSANMFLKAANDAGLTPTQAAEIAIERNWITVKREWLNNSGRNNSKPMTIAGAAAQALEDMRMRNGQEGNYNMEQQPGIGRTGDRTTRLINSFTEPFIPK